MLCIGQSHMACVLAAAEKARVPVHAIGLKDTRGFERLEDTRILVKDSKELTREDVNAQGAVFSFVGGMHHIAMGLRPHPQPFDFVLPDAPDLPVDERAELVPADAMRVVLRQKAIRHLKALDRIVKLAEVPIFQFEPPPPPPERWVLTKHTVKTHRYRRKARLEGVTPASRYLRYKLWRLNTAIVREHAEKLGVTFVDHPRAAVDEDGFLRTELIHDASHGNDRYGALLLEQMRSLAAGNAVQGPA